GACGCEKNTGDGAGILLQTPHCFLVQACKHENIPLPGYGEYGVGLVFLPTDPDERRQCEQTFAQIAKEEGQRLLRWRDVPTNNAPIGRTARAAQPVIRQIFIGRDKLQPEVGGDELAFERKLYVIRRRVENAVKNSDLAQRHTFYIASLSYKTLLY